MRILLTGATGFIGSHLIRVLSSKHRVTALVRSEASAGILESNGYQTFIDDESGERLADYVRAEDFDGIIHLATHFAVEHTANDIPALVNSNITLGARVAEAISGERGKWFVNTGTFWQHYRNEDYLPVNLYAATKQACDAILKYYADARDLKCYTLMLNDTFGPGDTREKVFSLWSKHLGKTDPLLMSPGEQLMDLLFIDDVVGAFLILIDLVESGKLTKNAETFALHAKERITLKALSCVFEETAGSKLNIKWGGRPYREREVLVPWDGGAPLPGWEPKVSISEGIRAFLDDAQGIKSNG